jgi:hypothetical protein
VILNLLREELAVARLPADQSVPPWALSGRFFSVTRTPEEMSVVCEEACLPAGIQTVEPGWRCVQIQGPLDFKLTGILSSLLEPLARSGIPVFVLSTYDTDYLLVKRERLPAAIEALEREGHRIER